MHKLSLRLTLLAIILGGAFAAQAALKNQLESDGPLPAAALQLPLANVPLQLGEWRGMDAPVTDPKLQIGEERLWRQYIHAESKQPLVLWMVYSKDGEDRGHHPEICMQVAGRPEDKSARQVCEIPGHKAPAQQYLFGTPGDRQWVFYWHYTLPPPQTSTHWLARMYQRLRQRPASVTIEVFAPRVDDESGASAQEFVRLVDAALQAQVGANAVRGSRRLPVTIITPPAEEITSDLDP